MKALPFDLAQACRTIEDRLVHRLPRSLLERAVYYHLLRHSHLDGHGQLLISMARLGRAARISSAGAHIAVHNLAQKGALRVVDVSKRGHQLELFPPQQIRVTSDAPQSHAAEIETLNFFKDRALRLTIYHRDAGRCFYCRRKLNASSRMLDHVQPQAVLRRKRGGTLRMHSYRNLVSCCHACNFGKRDMPAPKFLRNLYRNGHLDRTEFSERLAALRSLSRGKLRPVLDAPVPS